MSNSWIALAASGPVALTAVAALHPGVISLPARVLARLARAASLYALATAIVTAGAVAAAGPLGAAPAGGLALTLRIDALAAVMLVLVSFVGAIVVAYSRHYLDGDPGQGRFVRLLCATLAAVLVLVQAGNLLLLAAAWFATSAGLHRLLVFYPERPGAVLAARKKFVVSRLGDACLVAAALLLYRDFGSLDTQAIATAAADASAAAGLGAGARLAALLLVAAALLKSAQFPFHGWLLEVMETPTPVSALLHAGVINAGGYLVLRHAELIGAAAPALDLLLVVGALTALFGSVVMLTQTSVKSALAHSTIAQMGFMLLQCGLGAFSSALLHIVAHSLYKAHAFLSSGSVVDVVRTAWTPAVAGRPHPLWRAVVMLAVLAVALGAALLLGLDPATRPGPVALGAIVLLGLVQLVANGVDARSGPRVLARTVLLAAVVAVVYFVLQRAAEWLTAGALPAPRALRGGLDLALAGITVVAFAALVYVQGLLPHLADHPRWQALHAHVAAGLYVNTLANRWALRFWPRARRDGNAPGPVVGCGFAAGLPAAVSTAAQPAQPAPPAAAATDDAGTLPRAALESAIASACARIAPLWPLTRFVAVNPFLGFAGQTFGATCATLRRVARIDMLMPRAFFRDAIAAGRIDDRDLEAALADCRTLPGAPVSLVELRAAVARDAVRPPGALPVVATVAEVLDRLADGDRHVSRTTFMVDEISRWCAAYFDEAQSVWRLPSRGRPLYAAWRATLRHDRNPEAMGITGFRRTLADLPADPVDAIDAVIRELGIPPGAVPDYLFRALADIGGWAAFVRQRRWHAPPSEPADDPLVHLLAIRVVWGLALYRERTDAAFVAAWREAMRAAAALPAEPEARIDADLAVDLVLQQAYERGVRRRLLDPLGKAVPAAHRRPVVQAAFCIDVRSEVFRRALERTLPGVETLGFAGFFGFPIEYVPIGRDTGSAQCPVLLQPKFVVCETVSDAPADEERRILELRQLRRAAASVWRSFKLAAVCSFTYVETLGLSFAAKLVGDGLGLSRPVADPNVDGLDRAVRPRIGPSIDAGSVGGRRTGFDAQERVAMAEAVLRAMSLTAGFAPVVLLVGHGSTTVNNPHAASLDCGACGGHTGEANARVAARVLNDPAVRVALRERGIDVPDDTWFVAGLHDTTTDDVRLFDADTAPAGRAAALDGIRTALAAAGRLARGERSRALGLARTADPDAQVIARSRDWSQVRPEWGLAGNALFIAAPRRFTVGSDLAGRSFLHSYEWRQDADFRVLELILTAPMVVASWINLQYYAATVNNRAFGAGNKVLHNVVGAFGVLEGNGGDLKAGLPWQSVHDGHGFVHEPVRLNVLVAAPREAIDAVLARHASVRELVDNGWLHLFALDDDGRASHRRIGGGAWEAMR